MKSLDSNTVSAVRLGTSAVAEPPLLQPINWTQRILEKRKWLYAIRQTLPQGLIHRRFPAHTPLKKICKENRKGLKDTWVYSLGKNITSTNSTSHSPQEHRHAIVIPYRDRAYQLKRFLEYMSDYLKYHYFRMEDDEDDDEDENSKNNHRHTFSLYIVEQDDDELFNRALLMNAALDHVSPETECVVQHDVDNVPSFFARIPYHNCTLPLHLAARRQDYNFGHLYDSYMGAVASIHLKHWASINGMDNQMQGWGAEDNELYVRLAFMALVDCDVGRHGAPFRGSHPEKNVFLDITRKHNYDEDSTHKPSKPSEDVFLNYNDKRTGIYKRTGLSPSVASSGGWKQSKYHVVSQETWDLSRNQSLQGFAEIHHIKVKVDKSSLDKCFVNCNDGDDDKNKSSEN
ncbi:hypothetical protein ACA910_011746 [Epithemia clementina (nom. ined.)]